MYLVNLNRTTANLFSICTKPKGFCLLCLSKKILKDRRGTYGKSKYEIQMYRFNLNLVNSEMSAELFSDFKKVGITI